MRGGKKDFSEGVRIPHPVVCSRREAPRSGAGGSASYDPDCQLSVLIIEVCAIARLRVQMWAKRKEVIDEACQWGVLNSRDDDGSFQVCTQGEDDK